MPPEVTLGLRDAALRWRGLLVPAGVVSLLLVIIIPVPPGLLDLLLAASMTLAVLVLLTTIYVARPLDFSDPGTLSRHNPTLLAVRLVYKQPKSMNNQPKIDDDNFPP